MRNLFKTIEYAEHAATRGLEPRPAAPQRDKPERSPRAWHAPVSDDVYPEQIFKAKEKSPVATQLTVITKALKVTAPLDAAEIAALPTPDGQARTHLAISCDGKLYRAEVATKSLRKVKTTIAANGVENMFVMVQGKLKGNEIAEAGLTAQVKAAKQTGKEEAKS
jgi:hypothetical protein